MQSLIDTERISVEQARTHPQRNLLLQALDGRVEVEPVIEVMEPQLGDRLLVCSDGLSSYASDDAIHCRARHRHPRRGRRTAGGARPGRRCAGQRHLPRRGRRRAPRPRRHRRGRGDPGHRHGRPERRRVARGSRRSGPGGRRRPGVPRRGLTRRRTRRDRASASRRRAETGAGERRRCSRRSAVETSGADGSARGHGRAPCSRPAVAAARHRRRGAAGDRRRRLRCVPLDPDPVLRRHLRRPGRHLPGRAARPSLAASSRTSWRPRSIIADGLPTFARVQLRATDRRELADGARKIVASLEDQLESCQDEPPPSGCPGALDTPEPDASPSAS